MRIPARFENFIAAKRSRLALLLFALGLLALPASFIAGGIYHGSGEPVSWRPALDYFEWLAAAVGLACCIVAPFLPKIPVRHRIFLSLAAVAIYAIDLGVSAVAGMVVFGLPF
jgi:hypothetical protein